MNDMSAVPVSSTTLRPLSSAALRQWPLPQVDGDADKERRGHVLIIAGSREIPGAAILAAMSALRAGAGKLTVATPQSVAAGLALALPEARVIGLPESPGGGLAPDGAALLASCVAASAAVLAGPGLQDAEASCGFVTALLELVRVEKTPCVLDALAMDVMIGKPQFAQAVLITPHAGEMAHLTGQSKDDIVSDPSAAALELSRTAQALVVLKGADTLLATPQSPGWLHSAAIPGLATSGSGDVLAGIIVGLASRGAPLEQAAAWGIVIHALAGQRLARRFGPVGYLARELPAQIPAALLEISGEELLFAL